MKNILAFFRDWLTRLEIRWSMRRFSREEPAPDLPVDPPENDEPPTPGGEEINEAANRQQLVGRCTVEFQVTAQMVRDFERFFKRRRQARRCVHLAQHGNTARVRKKNAKRAEALSGPLVIHIPSPKPIAWLRGTPYGPGEYIREVDACEARALWLRPPDGFMP